MTVYRSTYYPGTGSTVPPKQVAPAGTLFCHGDCGTPIPPQGPSEWFCSGTCQAAWMQLGTDRPFDVLGTLDTAADDLQAIAYALASGAPDSPSDRLPPRRQP
jgi:hypothetical protein